MPAILAQGFLGAALILVLGVALALLCAGLPRLASLGEGPGTARVGLPGESPPAVPLREAPSAPAPQPEAAPAGAEAEEALVAAAVALALSLYQEETAAASQEALPPAAATSPWVMAGRWQAMQARQRMQTR
jgi:hypothetical protein